MKSCIPYALFFQSSSQKIPDSTLTRFPSKISGNKVIFFLFSFFKHIVNKEKSSVNLCRFIS